MKTYTPFSSSLQFHPLCQNEYQIWNESLITESICQIHRMCFSKIISRVVRVFHLVTLLYCNLNTYVYVYSLFGNFCSLSQAIHKVWAPSPIKKWIVQNSRNFDSIGLLTWRTPSLQTSKFYGNVYGCILNSSSVIADAISFIFVSRYWASISIAVKLARIKYGILFVKEENIISAIQISDLNQNWEYIIKIFARVSWYGERRKNKDFVNLWWAGKWVDISEILHQG